MQAVTGDQVSQAYVDQDDTGHQAATDAEAQGIAVAVVKLSEAKQGFVLLPKRWVVERRFVWSSRLGRLTHYYEWLATFC